MREEEGKRRAPDVRGRFHRREKGTGVTSAPGPGPPNAPSLSHDPFGPEGDTHPSLVLPPPPSTPSSVSPVRPLSRRGSRGLPSSEGPRSFQEPTFVVSAGENGVPISCTSPWVSPFRSLSTSGPVSGTGPKVLQGRLRGWVDRDEVDL